MISIDKIGGQINTKETSFSGLEKDLVNLPTEDIANGSTFYVMDKVQLYMFDAENKEWILQE